MSMGALGAFASGLAGGIENKRDRKKADEESARMDRYLDLMEKNPGGMGAIPDGYAPSAASGGAGSPGANNAATTGGSTLFGLIDKTEGGGNYDTLFGHSQNGGRFDGVKVSDMTIGQLGQFASPSGEYGQWVKGEVGRVATPMGRHQIVGTTLRNATAEMGLSPDTKFTGQTQDAIANHLARRRLVGASSPVAKRAALRSEWEGFKHVSDDALDAAIANFEANGGAEAPSPIGAR